MYTSYHIQVTSQFNEQTHVCTTCLFVYPDCNNNSGIKCHDYTTIAALRNSRRSAFSLKSTYN